MVCYAVHEQESWEDAIPWAREAGRWSETMIVVVGLQKDRAEEERVVSYAKAKEAMEFVSLDYLEVSTKTGEGMEELREYILDLWNGKDGEAVEDNVEDDGENKKKCHVM